MSESKHTPGPWRTSSEYGKHGIATVGYCGDWCFGPDHGSPMMASYDNHGSEEADARLCAAAPELLEALKDLVARYPLNVGMNAARAAIAKAEGA